MRATCALAVALAAWFTLPVLAGSAEPTIGTVKVVEGAAFVRRNGQALPAREGQALAEGDVLQTGADGRLGVILRDDTRLSLGADTEIRLDRFVFEPAQGNLALAVKMLRGIAAYVSGRIAKLSPDAVRIETPVAILGVRGTSLAMRVETE